ncbi:MAG TPA: kelch repeat-containing protein [Terriglobales bacterium]|nr:kelch repeat-containing protein [Terriglobales bacterium]
MRKKLIPAIATLVFAALSMAQTLQTIKNPPPAGVGMTFLLTDGTVLFQGAIHSRWYKLTPDINGSYLNGTWSTLATLPGAYSPDAFASSVLADGRVLIEGGEYNQNQFVLTNKGAIYDPKANTWTTVAPPTGWATIGDSPSVVLPDGRFLLGNKLTMDMAALDPATLTWTAVLSTGKTDFNAEEGWTLMPNGTVLTFDVLSAPHAERYLPTRSKWVSAGSTIVDLHSPTDIVGCLTYPGGCYYPPGEVGPAILRPDGTVFATGSYTNGGAGPGHTSVFHPGLKLGARGIWKAGPDFPDGDNAGDSWAALLPSGNVLVAGNSSRFYEFDGTTLKFTIAGYGALMTLPTGQVLVSGNNVQIYTPTGTYLPAWAPTIASSPGTVARGSTYSISGTQFNGLSQAAAFGDEFETSTNYPMVRITNNATHHVFYARTHNHSTMGVATGTTIVSTNFDVPSGAETGASTLEVVANGIPSAKVAVTVN